MLSLALTSSQLRWPPAPLLNHASTQIVDLLMRRSLFLDAGIILPTRLSRTPHRRRYDRPAGPMAEATTSKDTEIHKTEEKQPEKEAEFLPPEKPLPGDCCGSGCVRCVWDVYYEELEEYDNRRKKKDDSSNPK